MSLSASFKALVLEQMQEFGAVQLQPMFGGAAVKRDGLTFGLLDNDTLYLKVDEQNLRPFLAEGLSEFVYQSKNGPMTIKGYRRAPERLLDDSSEMAEWCRRSFEVAIRAAAGKKPKSARKPRKG